MNDMIKVLLTINLEGGALARQSNKTQQPILIDWVIIERDLDPTRKWGDKEGFKVVAKGSTPHYPLESKECKLNIKITEFAYDHMISNECPLWEKGKVWSKFSRKERLESHLATWCLDKKGLSYSYELLGER